MKAEDSMLLTTWGMMDVETYDPEPHTKYLVYVEGNGWTDGMFRPQTDSPTGWCHKWAGGRHFDMTRRGVTHFCKLPPLPNDNTGESEEK